MGLLIMLNFNSLSIVGRLSVRACQVRNFNLDGNFDFHRLIHGCGTGDQTRWGARCFDGKENQVRAYACPSSFSVFYFFLFLIFLLFFFLFFFLFFLSVLWKYVDFRPIRALGEISGTVVGSETCGKGIDDFNREPEISKYGIGRDEGSACMGVSLYVLQTLWNIEGEGLARVLLGLGYTDMGFGWMG